MNCRGEILRARESWEDLSLPEFERQGARIGLEDWFYESLCEEGLMGKNLSKADVEETREQIAEQERKKYWFEDPKQTVDAIVYSRGPEQRKGHPRFYALLKEIEDLHHRKNSNYARDNDPLSNFRECEGFDIPAEKGCMVRMSDKWARIKELMKGKPDMVGESLTDTLKDLAVYSLICIVLLEEARAASPEAA